MSERIDSECFNGRKEEIDYACYFAAATCKVQQRPLCKHELQYWNGCGFASLCDLQKGWEVCLSIKRSSVGRQFSIGPREDLSKRCLETGKILPPRALRIHRECQMRDSQQKRLCRVAFAT